MVLVAGCVGPSSGRQEECTDASRAGLARVLPRSLSGMLRYWRGVMPGQAGLNSRPLVVHIGRVGQSAVVDKASLFLQCMKLCSSPAAGRQ